MIYPKWIDAMNKELAVLESNETWELIDLLEGKKTIGSNWVYKTNWSGLQVKEVNIWILTGK